MPEKLTHEQEFINWWESLERLKGQRDAFTYVRDFLLCHGVKCSAT